MNKIDVETRGQLMAMRHVHQVPHPIKRDITFALRKKGYDFLITQTVV